MLLLMWTMEIDLKEWKFLKDHLNIVAYYFKKKVL